MRPNPESTLSSAAERRAEPRIYGPFPVRVRGVDAEGARFSGEAALDDMSAADFNLCLPQRADVGRRLLAVIGPIDGIPRMFEGRHDLLVEVFIVLDDEKTHAAGLA